MKYLMDESWDETIWRTALRAYEKEFNHIKSRLPKDFVVELLEGRGFHDSYIKRIKVEEIKANDYSLHLSLSYNYDQNANETLELTFINVSALKMKNLIGGPVWCYHEILPLKKARFSLEVKFGPDDGVLYVEFDKIEFVDKR
ncbi:MAG: DUF4085 domain-containing protein [Oscillospiraceae bacterium]|nr:DUF4085 domain-containing protein [Oscillospiraceae bacterium]